MERKGMTRIIERVGHYGGQVILSLDACIAHEGSEPVLELWLEEGKQSWYTRIRFDRVPTQGFEDDPAERR